MSPLHLVFGGDRHVVPQVIEAEFVIGAVSDITAIDLAPGLGVHLVENTPHRHPQVAVELTHPLAVPLGQVIVNGDQVRPAAGQGVEYQRHSGHQRLAFAGFHLGDTAVVQDDRPHQLHIKGHHVPGHGIAQNLELLPHHLTATGLDNGENFRHAIIEYPLLGQVHFIFHL